MMKTTPRPQFISHTGHKVPRLNSKFQVGVI